MKKLMREVAVGVLVFGLSIPSISMTTLNKSEVNETDTEETSLYAGVGYELNTIELNDVIEIEEENADKVTSSIDKVAEIEEEPEEPIEEVWQYGWTNHSANVRTAPSKDSEIYTEYSFNACVYYTVYDSEWVKIVYYDPNSACDVDAYISSALINNEECTDSRLVGNPSDMIGTGRYLISATAYYDKYQTGSSASGKALTSGYSLAGAPCWLGHGCSIYSEDGTYLGDFVFQDTGYGQSTGWGSSNILKGKSVGTIEAGLCIDFYYSTYSKCADFGRRNVYIEIY